jgi:hypothetical protein
MNLKELGIGILVLLIAVAVGYGIAKWTIKPETVTHTEYLPGKTDTTIVHDTLRIKGKTIAHLDTVYVDSTAVEVARMDTTVTKDSSSVRLKVDYWGRPLNRFEFSADLNVASYRMLRVDTLRVETTQTFPCEEKFWERFHIGVGYGATYLDDKVRFAPNVSLFYRIF